MASLRIFDCWASIAEICRVGRMATVIRIAMTTSRATTSQNDRNIFRKRLFIGSRSLPLAWLAHKCNPYRALSLCDLRYPNRPPSFGLCSHACRRCDQMETTFVPELHLPTTHGHPRGRLHAI